MFGTFHCPHTCGSGLGGRRGAGRAGGAGLAGAAPLAAPFLLLGLPSADTLCSASLSLALFFFSPV